MKRHNNLYEHIISIENLKLADKKARKGKRNQYGVRRHIENEEENILKLHNLLKEKKFTTSQYKHITISDGKERLISKLPYYPDRIVHTAIINILEPIFMGVFTADTYSCIKGRGIHKAVYKLKNTLKNNPEETQYCLKLDIKKYFPSVDNEILKQLLRKKFKDNDLLYLLDDIVQSTEGLALGNYTSQFLGNYYLAYLDHYIKEELKVKYFYRYCDDFCILHSDKEVLWSYFRTIKEYLETNLKLEVKGNYQVFPVSKRGIDFLGYKFYHTYILIRKSIKRNYIKSKDKENWNGWLIHADTKNLRNKYENN